MMLTPRKVLHSLIWTRRHRLGQLAVPEFEYLRSFLHDDDVALDIGAHAGSWTRPLADALPRGHVYAFEALPYYADVLRLTAWINRWRNVTVVHRAVGDHDRDVSLVYRDPGGRKLTGRTHVEGAAESPGSSVRVRCVTLDSFVGEVRARRVRFVKCDVEGFELPVLRGATRLLETHRPLLWCEVWAEYTQRYGYRPADWFEFLGRRDYRTFTFDPTSGWRPADARSYGGVGDVLAAPAELRIP